MVTSQSLKDQKKDLKSKEMFIYYDDNQGVQILPEAMKFAEVDELYKSDRTTNKTSWKRWLTYIYYTYKKDGILSGDLMSQKRKEVINRFFPDSNVEFFEKNPKVTAVIKLFIRKQYTLKERLYEKWKEDVDAYITYLTEVPYFKEKLISVPGQDGQPDGQTIEKIPNIDEKKKAQQAIQDLVETGKKLEQSILQEKKENKGNIDPLFDNDGK